MKINAVLPCAGRGERAGLGFNKTLALLGERPVALLSAEKFAALPQVTRIVIVCGAEEEADFVRAGGVFQGVGQVGELGAVALLLLMDIVGAHPGQQIPLVAVEVDEGLEAVFLAAVKEPVDGPLLIGLAVVGKEVVEKVGPDDLPRRALSAQGVGDEFQVLLQGVLTVDYPDEVHELAGEVVLKIVIVADGEDVVGVRDDSLVLGGLPLPAGVGQPAHIQGVPPEHTAHGVGDEGDDLIPEGTDIVAALHGLGHIVLSVENSMYCDILVGHLGGQLVLEAVDVDENAVQLLLVGLELLEPGFTFRLPGGKFLRD